MKILFLILTFWMTSLWAFDHTHQSYHQILQKHVVVDGPQTYVNYKSLNKESQTFDQYLLSLSQVSANEYQKFSKDDKLAFLINAYNAFTIKLILNNYPVKSIKDIGHLFKNSWKIKFFTLLGEQRNLDNIEHDMIRKNFKEPRIHFAVVCASIGCPPLMPRAYRGKTLEHQLTQAAKNFLLDSKKNRLDVQKKTLYLSKIFKWYGGDFIKKFGSVENYIAGIMSDDPKVSAMIKDKKFEVIYNHYDWNLNER